MGDAMVLRDGVSGRELRQEADVVVVEVSDIVDAVHQHGDAFDAHPEGESGVFFGINADGLQYVGVDDTGAKDLDPAGLFTGSAPCSFAEDALHIDFDGGFGEGEEAGAEAYFGALLEELFEEVREGTFELREGDIFIDDEAFELVEAGAVGGVDFVASVHSAGCDDAHGGLIGEHGAHLHGGGVRP